MGISQGDEINSRASQREEIAAAARHGVAAAQAGQRWLRLPDAQDFVKGMYLRTEVYCHHFKIATGYSAVLKHPLQRIMSYCSSHCNISEDSKNKKKHLNMFKTCI